MADRDYAELSQLVPDSSEWEWRSAVGGSVIDGGPSSHGPAAAASNGVALGNSALNARYVSGHHQEQVRR